MEEHGCNGPFLAQERRAAYLHKMSKPMAAATHQGIRIKYNLNIERKAIFIFMKLNDDVSVINV